MAIGQEEIGRRIKQAREDAGLTQPELAERLNLRHPQSISKYERGLTEVSTHRLERIAEVTGKPLSYFVQVTADEPVGPEASPEDVRALREAVEGLQGDVDEILQLLRAEPEAEPEAS